MRRLKTKTKVISNHLLMQVFGSGCKILDEVRNDRSFIQHMDPYNCSSNCQKSCFCFIALPDQEILILLFCIYCQMYQQRTAKTNSLFPIVVEDIYIRAIRVNCSQFFLMTSLTLVNGYHQIFHTPVSLPVNFEHWELCIPQPHLFFSSIIFYLKSFLLLLNG